MSECIFVSKNNALAFAFCMLLFLLLPYVNESKGAFTHTIYACVYRTALRFFITYLGLLMSMEKKVMRKTLAETGCGNSPLFRCL